MIKVYQATIYQVNDALEVAEKTDNHPLAMVLKMALEGLQANLEADTDEYQVSVQ